jgi:hypothetical protein
MAKKIEIQGTYLKITETINNVIEFEKSAKLSEFRKLSATITALFFEDKFVSYYNIANLLDENNAPFVDFYSWKDTNTGFKTASGGSEANLTPNKVVISDALGNTVSSEVSSAELLVLRTNNTATGNNIIDTNRLVINDGSNIRQNSFLKVWDWIISKATGAVSTILTTNLTASRVLVSDGLGKVAVSPITSNQLADILTLGTKIESIVINQTITNAVTANITSITLTPGKWIITGGFSLNQAASEKGDDYIAGIITDSITLWTEPIMVDNGGVMARMSGAEDAGASCIPLTVSITANTTYYLKCVTSFTTEAKLRGIITGTKVGII